MSFGMEMETPRDDFELAVRRERIAQCKKWGERNWPDGSGEYYADTREVMRNWCDRVAKTGTLTWKDIFLEEVYEALSEAQPDKLKTELVQCAAVIKAWLECIDRRADNARKLPKGEGAPVPPPRDPAQLEMFDAEED